MKTGLLEGGGEEVTVVWGREGNNQNFGFKSLFPEALRFVQSYNLAELSPRSSSRGMTNCI